MAFKKMTEYNEQRYGNSFRLVNDQDYADVIFLYRSTADVLLADTHYIKSSEYSGYVQCIEKDCPACEKGIRVQTNLFIPMLVLSHSDPDFKGPKIQFWDRSTKFQAQLLNDVFKNYPDPSGFVFRITRFGVPNDRGTRYSINVLEENQVGSYDEIMAKYGISLPESYDIICKDYSAIELRRLLSQQSPQNSTQRYTYGATPRNTPQPNAIPPENNMPIVAAPQYAAPITPNSSTSTVVPNMPNDGNSVPTLEPKQDTDVDGLGLGDDIPNDVGV
jgi:hypothetical protein